MKLMGYPTDSEHTSWECMKIFLPGFALNIDQIPIGPFKNVSKSFYSTIKYITRRTKANLILLTQKVYWYENVNDERVKSSLHPDHIVFHEYSTEETWVILRMMAKEGLNEYDKEALGLLFVLLVKDYRSDARIGITALEILGRSNKWVDKEVKTALNQAYVEVEDEILKTLGDRDLLILAALNK